MARIVTNELGTMLADGFAERMGREYLELLEQERIGGLFDERYMHWAHERGFFAESAYAFDLSDENVDDYLSDYDYFRVWPLNSWRRVWINDKLTLKYMLAGTEFEHYLPKYYYYAEDGGVIPLADAVDKPGMDGFLETLREVGEFACKPANAELAAGFHKLSYKDGEYLLDNKPTDREGVERYVAEHPNDLFTEFLHPGSGMEKISPVIHTLRVITINPDATEPKLVASYLRFATGTGGDDSKANYFPPTEEGVCSYNLDLNLETGEFGHGKIVYANRVVESDVHPETGASTCSTWPHWEETRVMIEGVAKHLGPVEYMGFDVCVTDEGPKLIEINSHSGSKYLQLYKPFLADSVLGEYFRDKMEKIDGLDEMARSRRNGIMR